MDGMEIEKRWRNVVIPDNMPVSKAFRDFMIENATLQAEQSPEFFKNAIALLGDLVLALERKVIELEKRIG